jgi:membrane-bound lytic murein transglycosylase B
LIRTILVAAVIVIVVGVVMFPRASESDGGGGLPFAAPAPDPPLATIVELSGHAGQIDQKWATQASEATGIPRTVLLAYVAAILGARENFPGCTLSWTTLAGIGSVESDHARYGGATVDEQGNVLPQILGVPLTGGDVENIPDSDGGEFDGTDEFDRAIGPMQIIPQTWRSWAIDADGNGVPDPHNIFDATLAAADYLCFHNPEWQTPRDWRAGISWYNSATGYATLVAEAAQRYGKATASLAG